MVSPAAEALESLREKRERLAARKETAQLQREIATLEAETLAAEREFVALEAGTLESLYMRHAGTEAIVNAAWQMTQELGFGLPAANRDYTGRLPLFIESDTDLLTVQTVARILQDTNPWIAGILADLTNYVVGADKQVQVSPRRDAGKQLAGAVQTWLDELLDANDWLGDREQEAFVRWRRDGRCFMRILPQDDGEFSLFRFVEPEFVRTPGVAGGGSALDRWLAIEYPAAAEYAPFDWTFGIQSPRADVERFLGVYVQYDADWEYLPASQIEYMKANVDRTVKAGNSDLFCVAPLAQRVLPLLRAIMSGAHEQARIATVTNYEAGVTGEGVQRMIGRMDSTLPGARTASTSGAGAGSTMTRYREQAADWNRDYAVHYHAPQNRKIQLGAMGSSAAPIFLEVHQAALRAIGARWSAPEFIISSDASNANYASTLVAQSPFVRNVQAAQYRFSRSVRSYLMKALFWAWRAGVFRGRAGAESWQTFRALIEIDLNLPEIASEEASHRLAETQRRLLLAKSGVVSLETLAAEEGYSLAEERQMGATPEQTPNAVGQPAAGGLQAALESLSREWRTYP